jgi:hypothetical protein
LLTGEQNVAGAREFLSFAFGISEVDFRKCPIFNELRRRGFALAVE